MFRNPMNPSGPETSVLIPAFNEERLIGGVIGRVRESFATLGYDAYEIVVCDNNSTDQTATQALEKGARVVHEPHNQISRARNTAAEAALGKWLIFLDADTLLNAELLRETLASLGSGRNCGGGSVIQFDGSPLRWGGALLLHAWNRTSRLFNLAAGAYLFCLREAWIETGGFDEGIYAGEEIFFSRALKAWGKKRRLKFKILHRAPVITSARKLEWYNQRELFLCALLMALPGSMRNRDRCALWYSRPGKKG